jgi:hypothetical protein
MTILITLICIAAVVGIFWYTTGNKNESSEETSTGGSGGYTGGGSSSSGNSNAFTSGVTNSFVKEVKPEPEVTTIEKDLSEIVSPDSEKPFANLKSNSAGVAETKTAPVKPKRKKSPAKTEKAADPAKPKPRRKYTKKNDN